MSHLSEMIFYSAEIGTNVMSLVMTLQVAGLHGVRPSTTLDKSKYSICVNCITIKAKSQKILRSIFYSTIIVIPCSFHSSHSRSVISVN